MNPFHQSCPETLYPQRNVKPFPAPMEQTYTGYPHSNAYHMLPREQTCPIAPRLDCHQPLVYQTSHELDTIDPVTYKQPPNQDFFYTKQVKNRPKQPPPSKYQHKYCPPHEMGFGRFDKPRLPPFAIGSCNSDPNLTNESLYTELNETQFMSEYN